MRTTESDEHHGENTQGREVLRCSDELRHPCWFRKHSISCLDLPQHSTDHRRIDNDRRGPRHRRVSVQTYVIQGVPFFWIFTSLISLSAGHTYRAAKHLILTLAGKHYFPHAPHLMNTQPTPTPTAPRLHQTESS